MAYNCKIDQDFAHYLESIINLNALDRMTKNLDEELRDSQKAMNDIKGVIDSLPKNADGVKTEQDTAGSRHEELSKFLTAGAPKLLLSDMTEKEYDIDLEDIISTMRTYTEDLKKNLIVKEPLQPIPLPPPGEIETIDLDEYAHSLDSLTRRLNALKLQKTPEERNRNRELEIKLALLCDQVNMFTQMVHTKTKLGQSNKNWSAMQNQSDTMFYEALVSKLLQGIHEVTYLIQTKN